MSSNAINAAVKVGAILIAVAGGYVLNGVKTKKEMDRMVKENNDLRHLMQAMKEAFKDASTAMMGAIADICQAPPKSARELEFRLYRHSLTAEQVSLIRAECERIGLWRSE